MKETKKPKVLVVDDRPENLETIEELEKSSRKLLDQQKAVKEEERLKVILEMVGATAHELNQPLMTLLGSIELIEICRKQPEKMTKCLDLIKDAGQRISEVVKKIQAIRHYDVKIHDTQAQIINFDQGVNILYVEDSENDFARIKEDH